MHRVGAISDGETAEQRARVVVSDAAAHQIVSGLLGNWTRRIIAIVLIVGASSPRPPGTAPASSTDAHHGLAGMASCETDPSRQTFIPQVRHSQPIMCLVGEKDTITFG